MHSLKAVGAAGLIGLVAFTSALAGHNDGDRAAKALAGFEKSGETRTCLSLSSVRKTNILDDYSILFVANGGATYLNELNGRCAKLGIERRFVRKSTQNQYCSGDIITVVDSNGFVLGGCSLGNFQALSEIPAE